MTTSNDISTPKKAESAPRQALELLAELRREAASLLLREHEGGQLHEYGAGMTGVLDALEPALRAQAEADKGLHALAIQARDARTSADRRAALDALERAALALGGTP